MHQPGHPQAPATQHLQARHPSPLVKVERIAIVGAGVMGSGIAQVCVQAGYQTRLADAFPGATDKALTRIDEFWSKGIAKGKTTPAQKMQWAANLTVTGDLRAAVEDADLVIEAVPESLELKRKVFAELDAAAPAHAVLATNTSSLSIREIADATRRPGRVLGMHFFNPVPLMQLLELVRHDGTAPAAFGKTVIVAKDSPGFATSRLGIILGNEAMRMLEERVASAADIDTAMRLGYGHPMGPLELSDLVGLDVRLGISQYLERTLGPQFKAPEVVRRLVARGELGKKTGKGLYDWSTGKPVERDLA
jgi:3-hydroxybutyryl-CoA dehydrogenase